MRHVTKLPMGSAIRLGGFARVVRASHSVWGGRLDSGAWSRQIAARHAHTRLAPAPVDRQLVAARRALTMVERVSLNLAVRIFAPNHQQGSWAVTQRSALLGAGAAKLADNRRAITSVQHLRERVSDHQSMHFRELTSHTLHTCAVGESAPAFHAAPPARRESAYVYRRLDLVMRQAGAQSNEAHDAGRAAVSAGSRSASSASWSTGGQVPVSVEATLFSPHVIHKLTDTVVQSLDRRAVSYRERMGVI